MLLQLLPELCKFLILRHQRRFLFAVLLVPGSKRTAKLVVELQRVLQNKTVKVKNMPGG